GAARACLRRAVVRLGRECGSLVMISPPPVLAGDGGSPESPVAPRPGAFALASRLDWCESTYPPPWLQSGTKACAVYCYGVNVGTRRKPDFVNSVQANQGRVERRKGSDRGTFRLESCNT